MGGDPQLALKNAAWPHRAGLGELCRVLGADNIRWVGGAIRDTLLGQDVQDVDCATTLPPEQVIDLCNKAGIRTVPTGIEHGTVTAIFDDGSVEITTLRHDVSTDGRRATVSFANDWREDAARRDFTINALYAHPETLVVSDYFGGLDDLAARRVRFIGDARARIREDHLRILRYFRFQARFGAEPDPEAEQACAELAATIKGLSRERTATELLALLALPDPTPTVEHMHRLGVIQVILPEAGRDMIGRLRDLVAREQAHGIGADAIRRLAALLPPLEDVAGEVAARLRLSRAQRARLVSLAERRPSDCQDPRALAYDQGLESAFGRLLLLGGDPSLLKGWTVPELPLKGGEIVARGISAGPQVARILRQVERRWIAEGFPDRDRVLALLDEELPDRQSS